jgi:polysaccharide biosynthesis protein PslG
VRSELRRSPALPKRNDRSSCMPQALAVVLFIGSTLVLVWNVSVRAPWAETLRRPAVAAQDTAPHIAVNPYSVNTFLSNEVEPWKRQKTMEMIERAHIGWIKQQFLWSDIEPARGSHWDAKFQQDAWKKYDDIVHLAEEHGVRIIARLDHTPKWARAEDSDPHTPPADVTDYGTFVATFVERYAGRVQYIQIWNEPNLSREWGGEIDPDGYFMLLREAYVRAKEANPHVVVLSAPMAMTNERSERAITEFDYWERLFELGAQDYFDVLMATGYGLNDPPETASVGEAINVRRVERLRSLAESSGAGDKPIWLAEFGWNASPESMPAQLLAWGRVTETEQAEWTARGIEWMDQNWPWFGVASIWYFRHIGDIPADAPRFYFRMVDHEFSPRLVYQSVQRTAAERSIAVAGIYGPLEAPLRPYGRWERTDDADAPFGEFIRSSQTGARLEIQFSGTDVALLTRGTDLSGRLYLAIDGAPIRSDRVLVDDDGRSYIDLDRVHMTNGRLVILEGYEAERPQIPRRLTIELGESARLSVTALEVGFHRSYKEFSLFTLLGIAGVAMGALLWRR